MTFFLLTILKVPLMVIPVTSGECIHFGIAFLPLLALTIQSAFHLVKAVTLPGLVVHEYNPKTGG